MPSKLHPLASEGIIPIASWIEFVAIWNDTPLAEFRHSLLHFGFNIQISNSEEWRNRILFYMKYADGYEDFNENFYFQERGTSTYVPNYSSFGERLGIEDVRKQVARKAFDVLCERIFKDRREDKFRLQSWFETVSDPVIFEAVLNFFNPTEDGTPRNFPRNERDHKREIVRTFLFEFISIGWRGVHSDHEVSKEILTRFKAARPRFVEILCALRRPDYLLDVTSGFHRVEPVDAESLAKLHEIAMNQKVPIPFERENRKPKTIEEAAASGSKSAIVYMVLKSREKEFERLRKISELEAERARLDRQLEKVKG